MGEFLVAVNLCSVLVCKSKGKDKGKVIPVL
jgi:hypothetical protein